MRRSARESAPSRSERARTAEALAKARGRVAWAAGIGLIVALGLAAVAGWQWREAVTQRAAAEHNLALATEAANSLVFDIAQKFRDVSGVPASLIKSILDRAGELQEKLFAGGQSSPDLLRSRAAALAETRAFSGLTESRAIPFGLRASFSRQSIRRWGASWARLIRRIFAIG